MPAPLALVVARGEALTITAVHRTGPGNKAQPVDITGWTIQLSVRKTKLTSVIFSAAAAVVNGVTGEYQISVTHAQTDIAAGTYLADIFRIDGGSERALAIGTLVINPDATYGG
jgi:hypothetical protein